MKIRTNTMKPILTYILFLFSLIPTASSFATECEKLSPLVCLESVKCTLDCKRQNKNPKFCDGANSYFCRAEVGECEQATNQAKLSKTDCEANKNCVYDAPSCFCPCDFKLTCNCACGGGPPPNCRNK